MIRKWYPRIFYYLLDLTTAKVWVLYKRVLIPNGRQSEIMTQLKFRAELEKIIMYGRKIHPLVGTPSSMVEEKVESKKHRGPSQYVTPKDVRLDQTEHMLLCTEKCANIPNCKRYTVTTNKMGKM